MFAFPWVVSMKWAIDEAIQAPERIFQDMSVVMANGEIDYLVGTIEDADESTVA